MTHHPSVYDPPTSLPFASGSDTSLAVAQSMEDQAPLQLHRVFYAILMAGPDGLTDQEIQEKTKLPAQSENPRRICLRDMGIVADSGRRRKTRSGRDATVWVSTGKDCPKSEPNGCGVDDVGR